MGAIEHLDVVESQIAAAGAATEMPDEGALAGLTSAGENDHREGR